LIRILDISNIRLVSLNNKYYKNFGLTKEYRGFKDTIKLLAKKQKIKPPVRIEIYMETPLDIDNPMKPIFDGLEKISFDDDKYILELKVFKKAIKRASKGIGGSGRLVILGCTIDINEHEKKMNKVFNK